MTSSPATAPSLSRLARSIIDVADGMSALRQTIGSTYGVSDNELRAAVRIATESDEVTPSVIARSLRLSTAAVTVIVDHLVERGLAKRAPKPGDRRSTLLQLTARGQRMVNDELKVLDASLRASAIPEVGRDTAAELLAGIAARIDPATVRS